MEDLLLSVSDLCIYTSDHQLRVDHVAFQIKKGERLGIIGASGSGKSLTAWSLFGIPPRAGHISGQMCYYNAEGIPIDILHVSRFARNAVISRAFALIPQNPFTSLNPAVRCGTQIMTSLRFEKIATSKKHARVLERLKELRFDDPERIFRAYPIELSGGELQRIVLAMATIARPRLLVADEPTTALDATTQQAIVQALDSWCARTNCALIFISHNTHIVRALCKRYLLMEQGRIAETGLLSDYVQHDTTKRNQTSRAPTSETNDHALLSVQGLQKTHIDRARRKVVAVSDVGFEIRAGESVGLVGSTGCGKSTIARILTGLTQADGGACTFNGESLDYRKRRHLRGAIQMIFQDPYSALYPHKTVGYTIAEPLSLHRKASHGTIQDEVASLMQQVGLPDELIGRFPHQLSGGERQRVQIARALAVQPSLLICDECVAGLDLPVQGKILELLRRLRDQHGLALLFISHDLSVVRFIADRVMVMEKGRIVESAPVERLFTAPEHPATRQLLDAMIGER